MSIAQPAYAQDDAELREAIAQMRAQMAEMAQRIDALEGELAAAEAQAQAASTAAAEATESAASANQAASAASEAARKGPSIAFKGAPEIKGEGGWSFKPRGRLQYDVGFTGVPATTDRADGFGNEVRRARLGVEGEMPGGFGYKFELDFAGNEVDAADAYLSYADGPVEIMIGQHNNFQSLEELTSSLHTTFIERAAFTDAFNFQRRIGASATYKQGIVLAQAGLFTDNFSETESGNRGADGRLVLMPKIGQAQLHLGGSIHYNDIRDDGTALRYRQRPLVHFTSERFINTGNIPASGELGYGIEAAAISGPLHFAAEGFWQKISTPGSLADPTFFGGYAEVGYFLTRGDTRGYKSGKFDRVKPSNPFNKGGIGSVQVNLRYDYLDLNDAGIIGGTQNGYYLSLAWKPTDYTLLLANYGRLEYDDAVHALTDGSRSYGVDAFGIRAQIDF